VIVNIEEKIKTLDQHLETERLNIKPLKASDAVAAFPKLQDDDLYRWISMSKPKSVESLQANWLRNESRTSPDTKKFGSLGLYLASLITHQSVLLMSPLMKMGWRLILDTTFL
jgi:hypothetical protein